MKKLHITENLSIDSPIVYLHSLEYTMSLYEKDTQIFTEDGENFYCHSQVIPGVVREYTLSTNFAVIKQENNLIFNNFLALLADNNTEIPKKKSLSTKVNGLITTVNLNYEKYINRDVIFFKNSTINNLITNLNKRNIRYRIVTCSSPFTVENDPGDCLLLVNIDFYTRNCKKCFYPRDLITFRRIFLLNCGEKFDINIFPSAQFFWYFVSGEISTSKNEHLKEVKIKKTNGGLLLIKIDDALLDSFKEKPEYKYYRCLKNKRRKGVPDVKKYLASATRGLRFPMCYDTIIWNIGGKVLNKSDCQDYIMSNYFVKNYKYYGAGSELEFRNNRLALIYNNIGRIEDQKCIVCFENTKNSMMLVSCCLNFICCECYINCIKHYNWKCVLCKRHHDPIKISEPKNITDSTEQSLNIIRDYGKDCTILVMNFHGLYHCELYSIYIDGNFAYSKLYREKDNVIENVKHVIYQDYLEEEILPEHKTYFADYFEETPTIHIINN